MERPKARIEIPRIEGYDCFGCGTENPAGLGLRFYAEGDRVCSEVTLAPTLVGWQDMAHGGIVATLLDEVMAWTVLYFKECFTVTREIRARYRKPVPVGVPLLVCGRIVDDRRRFLCRLGGEVRDAEGGDLLAEAEADFALLGPEQLELLPGHLRGNVDRFVDSLRQVKASLGAAGEGGPDRPPGGNARSG